MSPANNRVEKATIIIKKKSGDVRLNCHFNPETYTITRSNSWSTKAKVGNDVPDFDFKGGGGNEMSLKLFFDTTMQTGSPASRDVRNDTRLLWDAVYIDKEAKNAVTNKGEPPHVIFIWGRTWTFEAVITSISQEFVLFSEDGTPLRSNVTLKLKQIIDERTFGRQNPTSGSLPGDIYEVREGDRLDLIANEYYQKPALWRYIARHNKIANPRRLTPGQRLVIPELP